MNRVDTTYTFGQIAEITQGKILLMANPEAEVKHLLTDSRKVSDPLNSLFFAIKTANNNGIKYISELLKAGVRNFVVQEDVSQEIANSGKELGLNILLVDNVVDALQELVAHHRRKFIVPVVGITGSNGKTIVKEWAFQMLYHEKQVVRSPKSYNSQTGVPLSVWQLHPGAEIALFEAGISMPGEMKKLEPVISPTIGIFTNIGDAHQMNFDSFEQKVQEKMLLFTGCETLIYCKDHKLIDEAFEYNALFKVKKLMSWGKHPASMVKVVEVITENGNSKVNLEYAGQVLQMKIPFAEPASIENAMHCICLLLHLGYTEAEINARLQQLTSVEMRLEQKEGINNCILINDSYNSDPVSLEIALDFLVQQGRDMQKTVVLSDIQQSGKDEEQLYRKVSGLLQQKNITRLIGIGPQLSKYKDLFQLPAVFYTSTSAFLQQMHLNEFSNQAILIKGAREFAFERIAERLQTKLHKTTLEVNLSAMVHNLGVYRSMLKPGTKIMAMVKAFSYGSGSYEVASLLQFHKVDYLTVAYADEGVELRQKGITLPIMVMNPEADTFELMIQYKLEPEIYSFRILRELASVLEKQSSGGGSFPIHLKIDTGMNRLGFLPEEVPALCGELAKLQNIKVQSVYSHLAASEDENHDEFTRHQINVFNQVVEELKKNIGYSFLSHILNTGGIVRFPEHQMDMVRLGIGLYGVDTTGKLSKQLRQASTLKTVISQIKKVKKGETIGYSRRGVAEEDTIIATIGIGYADGFSRSLGNGRGQVYINGKLAPVIGNVCMDMCMINITGIDAREGDVVIVFGEEHPVTNLAVKSGTIPYEVLTGISQRVKRVYFQE